MLFMNEYDINRAADQFCGHPVLGEATRFLADYRDEVNAHSDGWPYWSSPVKAAKALMALIQSGNATEAQYRKALGPIRAFYTRRGNAAGMKWPTID